MAFAVVDFETTGILPSYHHRVVEIGVTHVEDDGTITGRWETLINPERDLGPQHIHGIRAVDILDAPVFSDIATEFAELLQGRVFAAHNAAFDLRFLQAEFERAGYWLDGGTPSVCTMALGSKFGLGASASLAHACSTHSIQHEHAHSAGADSYATAQLLSAYRSTSVAWPGWAEYWEQTSHAGRAYTYPSGQRTGVVFKPRAEASAQPSSFLERISTDIVRDSVEGADAQYLAVLDRCLLDGYISAHEGAQLADVASELGLTRGRVEELHADYYRALGEHAWADAMLTEEEQTDLAAVAALLEIPASVVQRVLTRSERPPLATAVAAGSGDSFRLVSGDMIVLTGDMTRDRADWETELRARGFVSHPAVTKKVKLVVAADPDSLSGKAKKARDYGIPIVSEDGLRKMLNQLDSSPTYLENASAR